MDLAKNEREILDSPVDTISRLVYSPSEDFLLVSSWDSSLSLYSTSNYSKISSFISEASILDCEFYNEQAVFGGLNRNLYLWDYQTPPQIIGNHDFPIKSVRNYRALGLIISGGWDMTIKSWDPRSPSLLSSSSLPGKIYSMCVSEQPGYLSVATSTKEVFVYDFRNLHEAIMRKPSPLKYQTRTIEPMPSGEGFAISSIEGRVGIEHFDNLPEIEAKNYSFKCHRIGNKEEMKIYPVNAIAFHPVGTFATGGSDGQVFVWDGQSRKKIWKLREYPLEVSSLSFSRNGDEMAIACSNLFEEGDSGVCEGHLFVRDIEETDVMPKARL